MLKSEKWSLNLQLFGGEGAGAGTGDGGDGAGAEATGVQADDPGRQRLLDKGVPEAVLKRYYHNRSYSNQKAEAQAPEQKPEESTEQDDAAVSENRPNTEEDQEPEKAANGRMSWDEIKADPEYAQKLNEMMRGRHKDYQTLQDNMSEITPMLELLSRKYGIDYSKGFDFKALNQAVDADDSYYEDKALETGTDLDTARKIDRDERETARAKKQHEDEVTQQFLDNHFAGLEAQAEKLKQTFPNFDLRKELKDPRFARMVSPMGGVPVENAYYAIHRAEIESQQAQVVAQRTMQRASDAIASGSRRPRENGTSSQAPSVMRHKTYAEMTPEERRNFRDAIRRNGSMPLLNRK